MSKELVNSKQNILIISTTASMIDQFNLHNIAILQRLGATVHVATNFLEPGTITRSLSNHLEQKLTALGVKYHQVDFCRGIGTHRANKTALNQLCQIIRDDHITGIHAHSPLGGIIARRAAHKMDVKIIYTAHGLQFFKGSPLKNWFVFFPVEWFYAHWTDALITINSDDYQVARYLPVKRRYYIPGVGTDIKRVLAIDPAHQAALRTQTRKRLGVLDDEYLIISIGELSKRKNHATVLKAIKRLNNPKIKYVIAGIGAEKEKLISLINELGLQRQVRLLGYLDNLDGLYYAADLNVFVSTREGLGLGGLDGIAHGLYMIGNANTGMKDYVTSPKIGSLVTSPMDVNMIAAEIKKAMAHPHRITDLQSIVKFDHQNVDHQMTSIYRQEFNL